MPKQQRFVVPREVVNNLVDDFMSRRNALRVCSSFRPIEMHLTLNLLPDFVEGYVDFNTVALTIRDFECYKLTAGCNRWTDWMRQRVRDTKIKLTDAKIYVETKCIKEG